MIRHLFSFFAKTSKSTCLNSKFHPKYMIPIQEHVLDTNAGKQVP